MTTCEHCEYFVPAGEAWGECRRNAPPASLGRLQRSIPGESNSNWPSVLAGDGCGDGKALAQVAAPAVEQAGGKGAKK
jgi:hypothetical protein